MSSTSRILSSAARSAATRRAVPRPTTTTRAAVFRQAPARRGYAGGSPYEPTKKVAELPKDQKTSDMPWAITSVAVTVVGCAYFWSVSPVNPKNKGKGHGHGHDSHGDKAAEATEEDEDESPDGEDDSKAVADNGEAEKDGTGNPKDIHRPGSMTGQEVPPPPAQEGSDAENATSEKKEEYKETIKNKDTKVATSSSDIPSKKTGLKFPDEDSKSDEDDSK